MSGLTVADRPTRAVPRSVWWAGLALAAAVLVTIGYGIGHNGAETEWRYGPAYVGDHQASITVGDWDYGFSESVAWIDAAGSHHGDGWPTCLDVPAGTLVEGVRFATVDVEVDDVGWRQIVLVDCRE